jgi:hypothetical protein
MCNCVYIVYIVYIVYKVYCIPYVLVIIKIKYFDIIIMNQKQSLLSGSDINNISRINGNAIDHLNKFKLEQLLTLQRMNNPNGIGFAKSQFNNSLSKDYHLYQDNRYNKIECFDENATETAAPTEPSYEYTNDSGNGDSMENGFDSSLVVIGNDNAPKIKELDESDSEDEDVKNNTTVKTPNKLLLKHEYTNSPFNTGKGYNLILGKRKD